MKQDRKQIKVGGGSYNLASVTCIPKTSPEKKAVAAVLNITYLVKQLAEAGHSQY